MSSELTTEWKEIKWVLTDVDDTLTWQGELPPETLIALSQLQQAGINVVAVTGACAGWCDHIAQLWPINAVLGENGAFTLEKKNGAVHLSSQKPIDEIRQQQEQLKHQILEILQQYPSLSLTLDQPYRLCEVAIDIGQNRPPVNSEIVEEIIGKIRQLGAHATASSIHINAWYGEHSKKNTSLHFLQQRGLSHKAILEQVCYVGDSLNDQQMFETLPLTAGVANILHYWDRLEHKPSLIMTKSGGFGFAQFAQKLLRLKQEP